MSQYGIIYRLSWNTMDVVRFPATLNTAATDVIVNIYDTSILIGDADVPVVYNLKPAMPPLTISVIDNNEDKMATVRGKQAVIRFLSDRASGLDMTTFCDAADNRFYVEITTISFILFKGFLMLSDMQQDFLPDPVVVELTASDHLGILKDVPLTDFAGINPLGKYRIADFIAMALKPTGLALNINAVNNLRHGTGSRTMNAVFVTGPDSLGVANADAYFFYPGQQITITGSTSNDGTFHVTAMESGIITIINVAETITPEAVINVTIADQSDGHIYDKIYLDAKTFEKDIGLSEDCRTVLDKILGESCTLFQWRGEWWIKRTDEMDGNPFYPFQFGPDGSAVGSLTTFEPIRRIGANASICHRDRSTQLRTDRPCKFIREVFKYETPKEIICNMDFSRGTVITPPDLSVSFSTGIYSLDCFNFFRRTGSAVDQPPLPGSIGELRKEFIYGTESNRFIVVQNTAIDNHYFKSQPVYLQMSDKFTIGVSWKQGSPTPTSGFYRRSLLMIRLFGDDGSIWDYQYEPSVGSVAEKNYWLQVTGPLYTWNAFVNAAGETDEDFTNWNSISADAPPVPVTGNLYVHIYNGTSTQFQFQGLQFTYKPFINGSYQLFTGQSNQVTRTSPDGYNNTRDNQVYISDSPRKEFKGAMFFLDSNGIYRLVSKFWSAGSFAFIAPMDGQYFHPYGYIQAYDVWNQFRIGNRIFAASLLGYFREASVNPDEWPDLINKYLLTDTNPNTDNRTFIPVSMSQDWKATKWTITFIETYNSYTGRSYTDPLTFAYLTS